MSIFGSIMSKLFQGAEAVVQSVEGAATPAPASATTTSAAATASSPASAPAPLASPLQTPTQAVDVEAVLTKMASEKGGGGNWQSSIVDLLKLLDLDSSLSARKELASELNVHVAADGSAEENIALHKAVMQKIADNGGNVPNSMKA